MSKLQTKIKLMKKNDEGKYTAKQYTSAEFLPGSVMEQAAEIQEGMMESKTSDDVKKALKATYDFVADIVFEGQFTGEEYQDGMDAREIASVTGQILKSLTMGYEATYAETKKK